MKRPRLVAFALSLITSALCIDPALSDRLFLSAEFVPYHEKKELNFFEPNQNAIIAFDGHEEILFLTTNASASRAVKVLEVLPLPSKPTVTQGKMETLETAVAVLNSKFAHTTRSDPQAWNYSKGLSPSIIKAAPAAVIVQHQRLGPHDINVVEVLKKENFVEWTESNLKKLGASSPVLPEWVKTKIGQYTQHGFNWFAFDVVDLTTTSTAISPLRYRFKTNKLFYPLQITKVKGPSRVRLVVMTSEPVKVIEPIKGTEVRRATGSYPLHKSELVKIDAEMNTLLDKIPSFERPHIQMWDLNNPDGKEYAGDLFAHF